MTEFEGPQLPIRESNDERSSIAPEMLGADDEPQERFSQLPWTAIFRIPLGQLITIGMLFLSVAGLYATVRDHSNDIAEIKSTHQTKESASAESKLIITKLESMEKQREQDRADFIDRFDRLEDRLNDRTADRDRPKVRR